MYDCLKIQLQCCIIVIEFRRKALQWQEKQIMKKTIEAKIEKMHNEIKALKSQLGELKAKKAEDDYKELTEYMQANGLTAEDVLESIKG